MAHGGGVGAYTQNLALGLSKSKDLSMSFFYSSLRKPYKGKLPNVKSFHYPPSFLEIVFNKARFVPIEKFLGKIDIYHSSDWMQPPTSAIKVTTYHDLVPIKYPKWSDPKIVAVNKRRLEIVEKEIDMVIAVSESTKKDLLELTQIPEDKITVIYEGVGGEFKKYPTSEVEEFRKKYKLPANFVLAIGGVGERKNTKRIKEATKDLALVIPGDTIPRVSDQEMPLLYNAAEILLYPSLYEGFGLPILEAMACGIPVITSDSGAMLEIAGQGNALFVNPEDVINIKKSLKDLIDNSKLKTELIDKGLKRAAEFSWDKTVQETVDLYKKLIG